MKRPWLHVSPIKHKEAIDWPREALDLVCVSALVWTAMTVLMAALPQPEPIEDLIISPAMMSMAQEQGMLALERDKAANSHVGHITFIVKHPHRRHYARS